MSIESPKFWRVLVRIEDVMTDYRDCLVVVVPGWNHRKGILIPRKTLPRYVKDFVQKINVFPCRIHARMNLGEEDPDKLVFRDWELPGS